MGFSNKAKDPFTQMFAGVVLLVFAYVLFEVVIDQAASSTANANIGSFSGAAPIARLGVTALAVVLVAIGIGLIGVGGLRAGGIMGFVLPVVPGVAMPQFVVPVLLGLALVAGYQAYKAGVFRSFRSRELSQARE